MSTLTKAAESDFAASDLGPVSTALIAELRDEARQHGVLVWLDKDGAYTGLVDSLIGSQGGENYSAGSATFPYPLFAYRGSFLELILNLDGHQEGVAVQPLVLHLPGFNEEDIASTPVYELYCSGRRHRIALPTLIRQAAHGKATPSQIDAGVEAGLPTLAAADNWLAALVRGESTGPRVEISANSPARLFDDLATDGDVANLSDSAVLSATRSYLERTLGLDEAWSLRHAPEEDRRANLRTPTTLSMRKKLQSDMLSWALCVEFVNDLKRDPYDEFLLRLKDLPAEVTKTSTALAAHIRQNHSDLCAREADHIEAKLENELERAVAEDLGRIDTFRFEDKLIFAAALTAIQNERWDEANSLAADRSVDRSFWAQQDDARRTGWKLVALAAKLGASIARHDGLLNGSRDLDQVAERYAQGGFEVDRAHRRLEQCRYQSPVVQMEEYPLILKCLNGLRGVYRRWADEQALAFSALCKSDGFLPEASLQQRNIFEDVVRPAVEESGTVAYFCVDALRFEMGKQLFQSLMKDGGAKVALQPRYAELPTVTEVGMNVLAPVSREGRLQPEITAKGIQGFRAGQSLVASPESRRKAMHERVGGETCPRMTIEDLRDKDVKSIRRSIARARLVVVHSDAIDKAGEEGLGLRHFDDELLRVREAIGLLREAGVKSFVLAADHGFLLHDDTTREPVAHGRKIDGKRRHVIEKAAADHEGETRVSTTGLRYDGDEMHFMFPESTMPFDVGAKAKGFVHGGNSLQERLIPVITVRYSADKGMGNIQYRVEVTPEPALMGMHRIKGMVSHEQQGGLAFGGAKSIELRLDALDGSGVIVELVDAPGAQLEAGALVVVVDQPFELLFRLSGPVALRSRIQIRAALGGEEVIPLEIAQRYAVERVAGETQPMAESEVQTDDDNWLEVFEEEGVRKVFDHIERFGSINEADATLMLGSPRKFRSFSKKFEEHAARAPFGVKIDTSSGQKRYMREGGIKQ